MQRKAAGLTEKIPDIQKTLETVQFLKTRTVLLHRKAVGYNADNKTMLISR